MKELKIVLIRLASVSIVSVIITALIRSIYLNDWLFVGLYIFVLLALQSIEPIKKKIELERKTSDLFDKIEGLKDTFKEFDEINKEDKDEERDNDK